MKKRLPFLLGFLAIAGVFLYLVFFTFGSSLQYYVTVSELKAKQDYYSNKVLKVAGKAGEINRFDSETSTMNFKFEVLEGGQALQVAYTGFAPDTFKKGSDVVVTGSLTPSGQFEATEILAKCASKYEAKLDNQQTSSSL